ncbi:MAG: acylneuraminate cytidylyltransferase family protein [Candidatus Magasanikbacteria bacterium]|nr:acylneuraminate cytidylyltransferase family protein [Candidatus Magasanikbacteria bacterium]
MKVLGIITARGGSKGIPGKNIKLLNGKPLIAYSIEEALKSRVFDSLIVSTDDPVIADVSRSYGADVPFMRPADLAQDGTPTLPVLTHAVDWLKKNKNLTFDVVVLLQPTTPLRRSFHIQEAVKLFNDKGGDSIVSVFEVPGHYNPHWQFKLDESGKLSIFTGESFEKIIRRRQDLPKTYTRNGAIYAFKPALLLGDVPTFYGNDIRAYIMDEKYSVNIDSMEDFKLAELAIKEL